MIAVVVALLLYVAPNTAVASPCFQWAPDTSATQLNCMTLFATPDLADARGTIALAPIPSPFGVAVRPDGRPRYHLIAEIAGLPSPRSLGDYDQYVAWAYTIALDSVVPLGRVSNGRVDLGEVNHVQFRILITAERGRAIGKDRAGRIVLRGTSPSARLLAHRDLLQPSAPGAVRDSGGVSASAPMRDMPGMSHQSHGEGKSSAGVWSMPPMPARMAMMPGMSGLVPSVAPYLPSGRVTELPGAATIHAKDGDTITLRAGFIRKTIRGHDVSMFGFNGRSPGPLINVERGATVIVRVVNAIDAATAVHWHGVRLDNLFDGTPGLTQPPIASGSTFVYRVRFPDVGVFWYHPHVREDVQQSLGLFGNIIVHPRDAATERERAREIPLVLDDILADDRGLAPFGANSPTHALMGRFGNVFLVNGEERPRIDVRRENVVRFLITNVSPSRIYNISIPGASLKVVATDVGSFEHEQRVENVVMGPAERYIVEARATTNGDLPIVNRVQALDHMLGSYSLETDTLAVIHVTGDGARPDARAINSFETLHTNRSMTGDVARLRASFDKAPDKQLVLTLHTQHLPASIANMLQGINAAVEWNDGMPMMNWLTTGNEVAWTLRDPATGKENMDIGWRFKRGDVVKLRIFNDPTTSHAMAHPIHIHGQRFLVLARDGVRSENLAWKDTAIIPAGETVDLLVEMTNAGRWMLHCHIAEHLSSGMMSAFVVE